MLPVLSPELIEGAQIGRWASSHELGVLIGLIVPFDLHAKVRGSFRVSRATFRSHWPSCFMSVSERRHGTGRQRDASAPPHEGTREDGVAYLQAPSTLMPRQDALPPSLGPRLISREAAAAYICVSPNTFDGMVREGRMPRPRRLSEHRRACDVRELDLAIDRLPFDGNDAGIDETWSDVDAPKAAGLR